MAEVDRQMNYWFATPSLESRPTFPAGGPGRLPPGEALENITPNLPSQINWDRSTLSSGGLKVRPNQTVIDVDTNALDQALKETDPDFYLKSPKQSVVSYMSSGKPISLPEVNNYEGQLRYVNGRHRAKAALAMGENTIPVAVDKDNEQALRGLLSKFSK
jgi:hypothetical protein